MVKRSIKVIKPKDRAMPLIVPVEVDPELDAAELKKERVDAVNNWIEEWRETGRVEKEDSDGQILAWRIANPDLTPAKS